MKLWREVGYLAAFRVCTHPKDRRRGGKWRMPAGWGSWATVVCKNCQGFRIVDHGFGPWQPGPLKKAVKDAEERQSEE